MVMLFPHMNTEDGGIFCGTGVLKFHKSRISPEPRENPQFSLADKATWESFEVGTMITFTSVGMTFLGGQQVDGIPLCVDVRRAGERCGRPLS